MMCFTWHALLLVSCLGIIYQDTECRMTKRRGSEKETKEDEDDVEALAALVTVKGDPVIHNQLLLQISTALHNHHIIVNRVEDSVFHDSTEAFVITGQEDNVTEFHLENIPEHIHIHSRQFFSNETSGTIVSVTKDTLGNTLVEGVVNDEYIIAPPGSQRRHRRALHIEKHTFWKQQQQQQHYERNEEATLDYIDVPEMFQNENNWKETFTSKQVRVSSFRNQLSQRTIKIRRRRDLNDDDDDDVNGSRNVVVVEALVIIDVKLFKQFDNNIAELGLFLMHFWHAVAFKFRMLQDPRIKLKLIQYGAFSLPYYQPFIERSRLQQGSKQISLRDTLKGFRDWMKKYESNRKFVDHDIAFLHTAEDLCEKKKGSCNSLTSGIGYVKGACITAHTFPNFSFDAAISEVGKSFKGVIVTVHELGHLLGAHHDGEADSAACPVKSGYVMSYQRDKASKFTRFSECSKASIKKFINKIWYSKCLRKTGNSGYTFPKQLPGKYMTLAQQCQNYVNGKPCPLSHYPLEERCERLCCETGGYRIKRREPAVDGTACGHYKVCMNGECILQSAVPS